MASKKTPAKPAAKRTGRPPATPGKPTTHLVGLRLTDDDWNTLNAITERDRAAMIAAGTLPTLASRFSHVDALRVLLHEGAQRRGLVPEGSE
jgi:hypothetical protein